MRQQAKELDFKELEKSRTYRIFLKAIKSDKTRYQYNYPLREFLRYTNLASYDEITAMSTDKIQNLLENWVMDLSDKGIKGNSIRGKLAPIELFLEMNRVTFYKRLLHKLIPKDEMALSGEVPFTTDEIKQMLSSTKKLRTKALIHLLASTGIRPGALVDPILRKKHLSEMPNDCLAVRVYDNSKEGYFAFLTPETKKALGVYFDSRKLNGEELNEESPLFVNEKNNESLSYHQLKTMMHRILKEAGISRTKVGKRYDKAANYGFRKRFNGILKMNNAINSNIAEKLMAHKKGLDGSYLKPTKEECFREFVKALQDLTIDTSERDKIKIATLEAELSEKQKLEDAVQRQQDVIDYLASKDPDVKKFIDEKSNRQSN